MTVRNTLLPILHRLKADPDVVQRSELLLISKALPPNLTEEKAYALFGMIRADYIPILAQFEIQPLTAFARKYLSLKRRTLDEAKLVGFLRKASLSHRGFWDLNDFKSSDVVEELNLQNSGLTFHLMSEKEFPKLTSLTISGVGAFDQVNWVSKMVNLETLELSELRSRPQNLYPIQNLKKLTHLTLSWSSFPEAPEAYNELYILLSGLRQTIKSLTLKLPNHYGKKKLRLQNILVIVGTFTFLEELTLDNVDLNPHDFKDFHALPIKKLVLNNVKGRSAGKALIDPLSRISTLQELSVQSSFFPEDLVSLERHLKLQILKLKKVKPGRTPIWSILAKIPFLKSVSIGALKGPIVTDSIPVQNSELIELSFKTDTPVSPDMIVNLRSLFPQIRNLSVSQFSPDAEWVEKLASWTNLESLTLTQGRLDEKAVLALARVPNLRYLDASVNQNGFPHLPRIQNLEELIISEETPVEFSDETIAAFGKMQKLTRLDLALSNLDQIYSILHTWKAAPPPLQHLRIFNYDKDLRRPFLQIPSLVSFNGGFFDGVPETTWEMFRWMAF